MNRLFGAVFAFSGRLNWRFSLAEGFELWACSSNIVDSI